MISPAGRVSYPRRQQYRRLSRAAMSAMASGASVLLALVVAGAGAVSAAGAILVLALGLGVYARGVARGRRRAMPALQGRGTTPASAKLRVSRRRTAGDAQLATSGEVVI